MPVFSNFGIDNFWVGLDGWKGSLVSGGRPKVLFAGMTFLWDRNVGKLTAGYARPLILVL